MKATSLLTTALAAGTLSAISFAAAPTAAMADNIVLESGGTHRTLLGRPARFSEVVFLVWTPMVRSCRGRLSETP